MAINQSLAHGLNILLLYEASTPLFTVSEISKRLGYSQSKTYRLVRTLTQYDLLREENGTAQYSLGLNTLRLGLLAKGQFNLASLAKPFMKELSLRTKETVLLTAVNGTRGVVLERVESEEPVRFSIFQPGVTLPLHCGASSKILMAHLPEEEWDHIISKEGLKKYTSNTITRGKQLKIHLKEILKRGYAFSDQEVDRDVRAVAAPIFNGQGELVAGLSVAGPVYRINKKRVKSLGKWVVTYAQRISDQLGFALKVKLEKREGFK
jgi:IclR family KDG regulon transcriptional repressor